MRSNHTLSTGSEIKPVLIRLPDQEGERKNAAAFIEQLYAVRRITQGHANIQKRAEVGTNPAWPDGFPNHMSYFFSVLEGRLGLKEQRKGYS